MWSTDHNYQTKLETVDCCSVIATIVNLVYTYLMIGKRIRFMDKYTEEK